MAAIGKYIYGVIPRPCSGQVNSDKNLFFGPHGFTACEEVYAVPYRDISAVVSNSEIVDYTHLLKDKVARYLIRHQRAIEKIMENFTIIPMRLGTFVRDEGEVKYILAKAYSMVKDVFHKIHDKVEIDVAATWSDFNSILKEIGEEKAVKEIKEKLSANPRVITLDEQMKVGAMVKKALDRKREKYAQDIQKTLKTIGQDFRTHELMDDKMVINAAFLINRKKREDFERKVEELNITFNEKLNFRCVAPLPPYSFYTLEIKKWQFGEIDWARKKLGLFNNFATKDEIKKAHQRVAFSFHPDKNPEIPGVEKEFNEVTKAYKVLLDYCRACEQAGRENYPFGEEEFEKNKVLVKVGR